MSALVGTNEGLRSTPSVRAIKPHPVDAGLPVAKLAAYGFQHVLAFHAGAVLVPIILAGALKRDQGQLIHLVNADLFTCGIAALLQAVGFCKIGVKRPLLQGVTFTAVSPMIAVGLAAGGGTAGVLASDGSVLCAGISTFFVATYFAKQVRFLPPVVTGSVILIIGVLKNLAYAFGSLGLIVIIQRVFTGLDELVANPFADAHLRSPSPAY